MTTTTLIAQAASAAVHYNWDYFIGLLIENRVKVVMVIIAAVGFLPRPKQDASPFYVAFFGIANFFAAQFVRAKVGVFPTAENPAPAPKENNKP